MNGAQSVHLVIGAYPPSIGGAQIHTRALAEELATRGTQVRVSCHWREPRTDWVLGTTVRLPRGRSRAAEGDLTVDTVGTLGRRRPADVALAPLYYAARGPVAKRFADRLDFDDGEEGVCHVVRMGREHLALRALQGARRAGRPVAITANHHERWSARPDPVWRRIYRQADHVFALTGAEVELLAGLGVDRERISVSGVGPVLSAEPPERDALLAATGLPDATLVTFLGQQYRYKGVDIAIGAFERIAASRPEVAMVIAGPVTVRTRRLVRRSRARERIHVVGPLDLANKTALLQASSALVLPSSQEAFGGVVVEAAATGCPYVVSDSPQLREVHEAVRFGAVARRTPEAVAEGLRSVLDDPPGDAAAARDRVRKRYSWAALGELYLSVYRRLTAAAPG